MSFPLKSLAAAGALAAALSFSPLAAASQDGTDVCAERHARMVRDLNRIGDNVQFRLFERAEKAFTWCRAGYVDQAFDEYAAISARARGLWNEMFME